MTPPPWGRRDQPSPWVARCSRTAESPTRSDGLGRFRPSRNKIHPGPVAYEGRMNWIVMVATAWPLTAAMAALVLGRAIGLADRRAADAEAAAPNFVVDGAVTVA
jgi:hypothetical protein